MTKFEKTGCILQLSAKTIEDATNRYSQSCLICSCRNLNGGYCKDSDCPITITHSQVIAAINSNS